MIPSLDHRGLLPAGVHVADFAELGRAFGTTPYRRRLLRDLGVISLASWHRETERTPDLGLLAKWAAKAAM